MPRKPVNLEYAMRRAEEQQKAREEEEYKQFCDEQEEAERQRAERQAHLEEVCQKYYEREQEAERRKIEQEAAEKKRQYEAELRRERGLNPDPAWEDDEVREWAAKFFAGDGIGW